MVQVDLNYNRELETVSADFDSIPVIDIAPFLDGSDRQSVVDAIGDAARNIGFLYIKNHGIDEQIIADTYAVTKAYFSQSYEVKQQDYIANSGMTLRGYIPIYGENVDPAYTRDFKECYDYGLNEQNVAPFFGPNPQPSFPEGFKEVTEKYHGAMFSLSQQLVKAIALSLGLAEDYFDAVMTHPITIQRLLHYPPQEGNIQLQELGIGAHTDYGFLTILCQDSSGGLQVQNANGEWIDAPPIDNTFIVNIGDLLQTLTNNRYKSTLHRVINQSGSDRYSLPFFLDMDFNAIVQPVPTCEKYAGGIKYEPYRCGEHKFQRFIDSYEHLKEYRR